MCECAGLGMVDSRTNIICMTMTTGQWRWIVEVVVCFHYWRLIKIHTHSHTQIALIYIGTTIHTCTRTLALTHSDTIDMNNIYIEIPDAAAACLCVGEGFTRLAALMINETAAHPIYIYMCYIYVIYVWGVSLDRNAAPRWINVHM